MLRQLSRRFYHSTRTLMSSSTESKPMLALPARAEETVEQVGMDDTYKLKELGPIVVNADGTLSRINNWKDMADIEKANVNRILLKRNKARLAELKAKAAAEENNQDGS